MISEWCTLLNTASKLLRWISITLDFSFFDEEGLKTIVESSSAPVHRSLFSDRRGRKGNSNFLVHLDTQLADSALFPALNGVAITVQRPDPKVGPLPSSWELEIIDVDAGPYIPPLPMEPDVLRTTVLGMMELTRKRLEIRGTAGTGMSSFSVCVM